MYIDIMLDFQQILPDGGPVYYETPNDLEHTFFVEPWNAFSSLAYLIPVFYWYFKLRGKRKHFLFLLACLPLMFLGGLGSTLFHGFRSSTFLLYMDFVPIIILLGMLTYYLMFQLIKNHFIVIILILIVFTSRFLSNQYFTSHTGTNLSYFIGGAALFIPALILLWKTKFTGLESIILAVIFFSLALLFREIDRWPEQPLEMGTHFLWHIMSAIGGYFLGKYLYEFKYYKIELKYGAQNQSI
jgi:hypothetical protein